MPRKFKPTDTWTNGHVFKWVRDRSGRPKSIKVGKQTITTDRFGLRLAPAHTKHVIVALDSHEFEMTPALARSVALSILARCNEIEK